MSSSLKRNSLYLLLARLTAQALSILFIAILARRLNITDFGQFALIATILLLGNTFTNFGTDTTLIRELARTGKITNIISSALALQLALSALWVFITLLLKPNSPLLFYSLSLFPFAIFSVTTATLRALERMDLFWTLTLANSFIQLIAAYFSLDIFTLCLYLLIGHFLTAALSYLICTASFPTFNLLPLKNFSPLLNLTLPFAALTFLIVLSQRLGVLITSALLGDSATAIFSSTLRIVDGLKLGHYAILGALLPVISRGAQESKQSFRKGFFLLLTFSLIMAIGLAIFPRLIILILYGEKFTRAIPLLSLLGWSLIPYTISSFISYDLIARGREMTLVKATAISLTIYIVLYFWLISAYQLHGAVYAAVVGEIIQSIIFVIFQRRGGVTPPLRNNENLT